jgi:hypothetical protein
VVSDLAHLVAELLENATTFSPPHTRIRLLGRGDSEGYTLVVVDEGIGMTPQEMALANHHLAMAGADLTRLPGNSRMLGLGVVGRLAARHDLVVALADAPLGGTVARVTLPHVLLVPPKEEEPAEEPRTETALLTEAASVFSRTAPPANAPRVPDLVASNLRGQDRAAQNGSAAAPMSSAGPAAPSPAIAIPSSAAAPAPAPGPAPSPVIPAQPRSGDRTDVAPAPEAQQASIGRAAEGVRHSGQSLESESSSQVTGHANAYGDPTTGASSVTVGTQPHTAGALPARTPGTRHSEVTPPAPHTAPQENSEADSGTAPSTDDGQAAESVGGLRRRIRGENLPDTGSPEPVEPIATRDAAGVHAALSSFKAGRDLANRDS